mmetsp:Transcript_13351/g.24716  ORF Transcript_13351/g.24716 Transcript_13351/m.24716 type:complete len:171 (-) Transcript_13351:293-805(-)
MSALACWAMSPGGRNPVAWSRSCHGLKRARSPGVADCLSAQRKKRTLFAHTEDFDSEELPLYEIDMNIEPTDMVSSKAGPSRILYQELPKHTHSPVQHKWNTRSNFEPMPSRQEALLKRINELRREPIIVDHGNAQRRRPLRMAMSGRASCGSSSLSQRTDMTPNSNMMK